MSTKKTNRRCVRELAYRRRKTTGHSVALLDVIAQGRKAKERAEKKEQQP